MTRLSLIGLALLLTPLLVRAQDGEPSAAPPEEARQIVWTFGLPYVNSFLFRPAGQPTKVNTGFWGASVGLERRYRSGRYLSFEAAGAVDLFTPVPASPGIDGIHESMASAYVTATDNVSLGPRTAFGYGVHYAFNSWQRRDYNTSPTELLDRSRWHAVGFVGTVNRALFWKVHGGLSYRPSFIRLGPTPRLLYEHVLSVDFTAKFEKGGGPLSSRPQRYLTK